MVAAVAVTVKRPRGPSASIAQPESAAAPAEPAVPAEPSREIAWVRTQGWTVDSVSWEKSATRGGIVVPVRTTTHPR